MIFPHHANLTVKLTVQPKNPNGYLSGRIVHKKNKTFVVTANSEKQCIEESEGLLKALSETYEQWLDKKNLNAPIAEPH